MMTKKMALRVEESESGFCIWINDRWVIDGSTFNENRVITVAHGRLSEGRVKDAGMINVGYRFVGDAMDKRYWKKKVRKHDD